MRYTRYIWPALLLIAAILSPDTATTVTLLVAGILTILLAVSREKKLAHVVSELSDLLAIERKTSSVAMERSLHKVQNNMLLLAVTAQAIIFIALLLGSLDITVARNYALLVLVALAPLGLELELLALLYMKHKHNSETVRTAIGYASEDARAILAVVGLSFVATLWLHIPPALSALQVLFITCIARPLLSGRALQTLPYKPDQAWRVTTTALITYGSFIFYYIRHYLEPRYADSTNVITWHATTVALATFIACQAFIILFEARRLPRVRLAALTAALISIFYTPVLATYFMNAGIAASDWVWVLLAGCTYGAIYLIRHRT